MYVRNTFQITHNFEATLRANCETSSYFVNNDDRRAGINTSVLVLRPSSSEFRRMLTSFRQLGVATDTPEQSFLNDFYFDRWIHLPLQYNYQVDQLRSLDENIMIAHFSGNHGPHEYLFGTDIPEVHKFEDYIDHVLLPNYKVKDTTSEQRVRGICVAWKTAWNEMWRELIARVHTQKPHKAESIMKCPVCGQSEEDRGLTFEHTFFECK